MPASSGADRALEQARSAIAGDAGAGETDRAVERADRAAGAARASADQAAVSADQP